MLGTTTTRRTLLTAATTTAATLALGAGPAYAEDPRHRDTRAGLRELEARHGARIGAFAYNLRTKATVRHRAAERFPLCSVFKTLAAAAVLRDLDRHGETLARRIHYTAADLAGYSPKTGEPAHLAGGMTVGELCDAAIRHSDNTAANLLLRELGGPTAITRFCRSLGDPKTRLDRWEPELNTAEPWRVEDTTTPGAIAGTYARLVLGDALHYRDRDRLTTWLLGNTTSGDRFRKGLPEDWTIADKTGTGDYGTSNDVGIAWTPDGAPVALAVLSTKPAQDAAPDSPLVAAAASVLAAAVG
ncbi:class A beta-lactamase [Streptomyces mirabilis]|uniref:class A beta-lactamase n=1 Tax=Streptomyces mirabilis TaxID=68239 RepID=UPI00365ADC8A